MILAPKVVCGQDLDGCEAMDCMLRPIFFDIKQKNDKDTKLNSQCEADSDCANGGECCGYYDICHCVYRRICTSENSTNTDATI